MESKAPRFLFSWLLCLHLGSLGGLNVGKCTGIVKADFLPPSQYRTKISENFTRWAPTRYEGSYGALIKGQFFRKKKQPFTRVKFFTLLTGAGPITNSIYKVPPNATFPKKCRWAPASYKGSYGAL